LTPRPAGQEAPALALGAAILPGPGLGGGGPWDRGARAHGEGVLRAEHPIGLPEVLGRHGRSADAPRDETGRFARGEESRGSNATSGSLGRGRSYTLARLRRDRPELAERVEAGELSANAAAVEAEMRRQGERRGGKRQRGARTLLPREEQRTATLAAKAAGFKGRQAYERARAVVEAAEKWPAAPGFRSRGRGPEARSGVRGGPW